ncbi:MAG: hypothetical protein A2452_05925 [Candidatus Firestonebacteria bacterium RIFOXYC2_FULL_39_67]|nr:MAG: hypothetical protein A2536_12540 [Candidatus Firestonebacteria bacterium RIFOXYD2_FULL_39_29]OGF56626.1 MAG: hypothetical protein A2452_05925 [Candidatus Firestonebacteria bacterium RIFOXYC2_FULL_39_67]
MLGGAEARQKRKRLRLGGAARSGMAEERSQRQKKLYISLNKSYHTNRFKTFSREWMYICQHPLKIRDKTSNPPRWIMQRIMV